MLANVPLVITASLPLRAPYELNSRGVSLRGNIQREMQIQLKLFCDEGIVLRGNLHLWAVRSLQQECVVQSQVLGNIYLHVYLVPLYI